MHSHMSAIVRLVVLGIIAGSQSGAPGLFDIPSAFSQPLPPTLPTDRPLRGPAFPERELPIPPTERPLGGPGFDEPDLPIQQINPPVGRPCPLELGQINIDLKAKPTGPFSVQLTWSGPPAEYQIYAGSVIATVTVKPVAMFPRAGTLGPDLPHRGGAATHEVRSPKGTYEHKSRSSGPPVLPDTDYTYAVQATLSDGKKACGTTRARTLPPPPITNLVGWYVSPNDIRFKFDLPPHVNAVNIYRDNVTKGWKPTDPKRVYQITRDTAFNLPWNPASQAELKVTDPQLPPLPNDYSRPPGYDFTIEAVWSDGAGNAARTVKAPIHIDGSKPIWGFADTHAHQFANLAFGGLFVWGKVWDEKGGGIAGALPWCDYWPRTWPLPPGATAPSVSLGHAPFEPQRFTVHGPEGINDWMGAMVAQAGLAFPHHHVGGHNQFDGWPRWNSVSHQMMYHEWLKRAYDGGMRLMVMQAVNSKALCKATTQIYSCDDMEAVDRQLKAAHDLEAFIDKRSGGPGKGWYRIVRNPQEARRAISKGQMAIVLGIEVPDLFGCATNPSQCAELDGKLSPYVIEQLDKYTGPGYDVRHLFPIHSFDNALGGTAFFQDQYRISQRVLTNQEVSARDCSGEGVDFKFHTNNLTNWLSKAASGGEILRGFEEFSYPACNAIGLKIPGQFFLYELMNRHMIIDIDHMSHSATDRVLEIAKTKNYPVISGHAGILETSVGRSKRHEAQQTRDHMRQIAQLGGMGGVITAQGKVARLKHGLVPLAPIFNTQADRIDTIDEEGDGIAQYSFRVKNDCSNSSKTFAQAYHFAVDQYALADEYGFDTVMNRAAVAFGTDMQGAWIQPGPRFGEEACSGAGKYRDGEKADQVNRVQYPFKYPWSLGYQMPKLQAGSREFDINTDGVANVGMLPDFIADLFAIGLTEKELQPLFRSTEGYIRMWERASYRASSH